MVRKTWVSYMNENLFMCGNLELWQAQERVAGVAEQFDRAWKEAVILL